LDELAHGSSEVLGVEQKKLRKKELQAVWAVVDSVGAEIGTRPTRKRTYGRSRLF